MIIRSAVFVKSSARLSQCPPDDKPEFAFIGRSNVGKSSLINCLTGHKSLAHISSHPGKTQTINHYLINGDWFLVDLPGYGYAKVSQTKRVEWGKNLYEYLRGRKNLINLFVLVDIRVPPQQKDLDFINKAGLAGLPLSIVFTKRDKISAREAETNVKAFCEALLQHWEAMPVYFITSAEKGEGRDELLKYINESRSYFSPAGR